MAEKIEMQGTTGRQKSAKTTKLVRNRSGHRVELVINEKVMVFLPGKTVEVPIDCQIPGNLGLFVR